MEKVFEYTFYDELRSSPEEHPIMLTDSPLNSNKWRETAAQLMFEVFNVPCFYLKNKWESALYASGRITGLVLKSGEEVTNYVPIYEGYWIPNATQRTLIGGKDITKYLIKILKERLIDLSSTKEFKIAK